MREQINNKLLEVIKKSGLRLETAVAFCALWLLKGEDALDILWDTGWLTTENEHKYRIALLQKNTNTDKMELRFPFLEAKVQSDFIQFYVNLGKQLPNTKGKLDNTETSRKAFEALVRSIPDFDQTRLLEATIQYYREEELSKKLSNYLVENAFLAYETFTTIKHDDNMV